MNNYDQLIYNIAREEGFTDIVAKLIAAQARVETFDNGSDYNSQNFKCNNNMFGMKYVGQDLATKGTPAPASERKASCGTSGSGCDRVGIGNCSNSDFYARYASPEDSVRDAIQRLFKKTVNGISPEEFNTATDSTSYAIIQKKRGYYGFYKYGDPRAESEINGYASGLRSRLAKVSVTEWVKDLYKNNTKTINFAVIGAVLVGLSAYGYFLYKKGLILKK